MNRLDKVFIAAINGLALGGGCELALACDVRIMAKGDHRIGLPEMTLGIIPGAGGTQRLSRVLGPGRALEMMLEGRALTSEGGARAGSRPPHRGPADAARGRDRDGGAAGARSPAAVAALKRAVYEGASRPLSEGLHIERAGFLATASTEAAQRAMQAYADEVERLGDVAPWQSDGALERWQDGDWRVDMVASGAGSRILYCRTMAGPQRYRLRAPASGREVVLALEDGSGGQRPCATTTA